MSSDNTIASIESWACSLPLPSPLDFGGFTITSRQYTAVRVTTASGQVADVVGLSRRAPVDTVILDVLAPQLVGKDPLAIRQRLDELSWTLRALEHDGLIGKAKSLLEICLWDLLAQTAELPLWKLLGGDPRPLPIFLVEGYPIEGESDDDFSERVARRADEGYRGLKLEAASYPDASQAEARLRGIRKRVDDDVQLVVDMLYTWRTAAEGAAAARAWCDQGIAWLEDPLHRTQVAEIGRLRELLPVPIASGDEATRTGDLYNLMDAGAIDVLRLDATTQGGIAATTELLARARRDGLRVSSHVHPEVHQHLAFASGSIDHIEAFPLDDRFDRTHTLLREPFMAGVKDGIATPPSAPGTGISLDLEAVRASAYRHGIVRQD